MNPCSDIILVQKVLQGDANAFRTLVDHHKDMAYTLALKITGSSVVAEEIAMDSFIKAYNSLSSFRQESQFKTWLYRIVYNTAISYTRKKKQEFLALDDRMIEQHPDEMDSMHELSKEEQFEYMEKAIKALPPDDELLITLFYREELSVEEISKVTALSVSNVKVKLHRIRKRLAIEIQDVMNKELKEEYI